ncbi:hypothetical protein ACIQUG_20640 [Ensifer sp. NPDC090286]|uniref:hypothetical protein n=1 Tax=Ensifer sp. NPDC090286 TaxID=3363991 RepID=UPI00383ACC4A
MVITAEFRNTTVAVVSQYPLLGTLDLASSTGDTIEVLLDRPSAEALRNPLIWQIERFKEEQRKNRMIGKPPRIDQGVDEMGVDVLARARDKVQGVAPGEVTLAELNLARETLGSGGGDIGAALYVVALRGGEADAGLIESFLYGDSAEEFGDLALKCLCRYLGLIERYRSLVRSLIMSDQDAWYGSRAAAIFLSDVYFKNYADDELGCRLVTIFCNSRDREQGAARDALVVLLDIKDKLEDPHGLLPVTPTADVRLIREVAQRRFGCV